jgi:hypothetical protein
LQKVLGQTDMSFSISLQEFTRAFAGTATKIIVMPLNGQQIHQGCKIEFDIAIECENDDPHSPEFALYFNKEIGHSITPEEIKFLDESEFVMNYTVKQVQVWPDIETAEHALTRTTVLSFPSYEQVACKTERKFTRRDYYSHFVLELDFTSTQAEC